MSSSQEPIPTAFELPRPLTLNGDRFIAAPSYTSFAARFGNAYPEPHYLESDLGKTAVFELSPPSGQSKMQVLILHGANTPALGMLALAKELQALDANLHIVLYDLWGHGLSSTPLVAHTPQIFHSQIFQVLGFMHWNRAHMVGFSFGGATIISFTLQNPGMVQSAAILAPGGLLHKSDFDPMMQQLLDATGKDAEAADAVLSWLEGGPLVVPEDWQEQTKSGRFVAEAFRQWELQEHRGYSRSVLSMFRHGGVLECEVIFRAFANLPVRQIAVLAEHDEICNERQLLALGFKNIEVVRSQGHAFVRTVPGEVARIIHQFWQLT